MNDGGKGDKQRPTDHKKWSSGYDNIKWTKEDIVVLSTILLAGAIIFFEVFALIAALMVALDD